MKENRRVASQNTKAAFKPSLKVEKEQGFVLKNKELILLFLVLLVTFLIYFPSVHHSFTNWDDNDYVTENQYIKSLSSANLTHIFTKPIALNYHPLTMLSLALTYKVSGVEPYSYFLVNIVLHILNTLLVFYFAFLVLARNKPMALFVAAIFAVHPMHVESVAWISERKDVLYTFFFLSGLIAWMLYLPGRRWYWYLFSLILFGLAGLSKPSAVVFPLVLLLLDYLNTRKFNWLLIVEKIPFFAISVAIGLATLNAQLDKSVVAFTHYNFVQQFLFASYGFFIYIVKLIVPFGLSAMHPVPVFNNSLDLPLVYFISPFINAILVGLVLFSLKYTRVLLFCFLFYLVNIMLTLQFMQVGSAVIAERYTYLSYIGLLLGFAWLMNRAADQKKVPVWGVYLTMAIFFSAMTVLAIQRVPVWKNSGTLWSDVIEKYPKSHTAYNNRGYYLVNENKLDEALPDFTKSIELVPNFVDALNNRGSLYRLQNQPRLAIYDYHAALAIDPDHVKALSGRGNAYASLGLLDSALLDFNKAYSLNPGLAIALGDRGSVYFRLGQFENAIEDCSRKIAVDPENRGAYLNRGVAYSSLKKWDLAIRDFTVVINARTDNPMVYEWRGVAFQSVGSFQPAIDDFSRGITMSPAKPSLYVNRGKAYKELGMQQKSADDFLKARQLGVNIPDAQFK